MDLTCAYTLSVSEVMIEFGVGDEIEFGAEDMQENLFFKVGLVEGTVVNGINVGFFF